MDPNKGCLHLTLHSVCTSSSKLLVATLLNKSNTLENCIFVCHANEVNKSGTAVEEGEVGGSGVMLSNKCCACVLYSTPPCVHFSIYYLIGLTY